MYHHTPPFEIQLIGMGTGSLEHLSFQAAHAIQNADLILLPQKGEEKSQLIQIRLQLCEQILNAGGYDKENAVRPILAFFDYPQRNSRESDPRVDYENAVHDWHDKIAQQWTKTIIEHFHQYPHLHHRPLLKIALLVWGDASLYDSTQRIARRLRPAAQTVCTVAGISTPQALAAAHGLELCALGQPLLITTGRWLRERGWPWLEGESQDIDFYKENQSPSINSVLVMLDGQCSFQTLNTALAARLHIWWGAYVGMDGELLDAGSLPEAAPRIQAQRARARAQHGWVMDAYLLRFM